MSDDKEELTQAKEKKESVRKKVRAGRVDKVRGEPRWKAKIADMLVEGEEVLVEGYIHWGIFWHAAAVLVFAVIVALVVFELGLLLGATALIMFAFALARKEIFLIVLTNKRILVRYGLLQIDVVDMRLSKIESIELERMLPGYLLGYANVVLMGTGQRYVVIPYVGNAIDFRRAYNKLTLADDELEGEG